MLHRSNAERQIWNGRLTGYENRWPDVSLRASAPAADELRPIALSASTLSICAGLHPGRRRLQFGVQGA